MENKQSDNRAVFHDTASWQLLDNHVEHFQAKLRDVSLHVATLGQGEPVVLLHGFPEFWYSWRHQLSALASAGFQATAPDLRGYNLSDRPPGIHSYAARLLVSDIAQLIEQYSGGKAYVVGHDWGGILAWRLAALRPELIRKLIVLNAPHPAAYRRVLATHPRQWLRSSYALGFQLPWLAEWIIKRRDFWLLDRVFRRQPTNPDAFRDEDIARYKEALNKPSALTAALNYYRAALRYRGDLLDEPQTIPVPTLVLWGDRDPYLSTALTQGLDRWVPDLRIEHLSEASHWVQNDAPDFVNRLIIDFLKR